MSLPSNLSVTHYSSLVDVEKERELFDELGSFHKAKVVLHCIGKYTKASWYDTAFTQAHICGTHTLQTVRNGSHYVRALRGMQIILETFQIMKWEAFLEIYDFNNQEVLDEIEKTQNMLSIF